MPNQFSNYTKNHYLKGKLNLFWHQRRLLLITLRKCNWNVTKAYQLNFTGNEFLPLTFNEYLNLLKKHHISVKEKSFKKISQLN